MRASFLIAAILGGTPVASQACSCIGTQSVGSVLTSADAVIVGKVTGHTDQDYSYEHQRPAIINVEVVESLRGSIKGRVEIAKTLMCYQSIPEDDFEVGKAYVFPLEQIDLANTDQTWGLGLMIGSDVPIQNYKMFRLPVCAHNALLLDGRGLYTSELTSNGGRRLEYYMPLPVVKVLLPIGLLSIWSVLVLIAIAVSTAVAIVVIRKRRRTVVHGV
jgi:hypothetical protein